MFLVRGRIVPYTVAADAALRCSCCLGCRSVSAMLSVVTSVVGDSGGREKVGDRSMGLCKALPVVVVVQWLLRHLGQLASDKEVGDFVQVGARSKQSAHKLLLW